MTMHSAQYLASGEMPRKVGSGQVGIAPYRAFRTADGELVVAAGNDKLFRGFCQVLGHPEWTSDTRFLTNPDRARNAPVLNALIEEQMLQHGTAHWTGQLDAAGVPCAPVQNVQQMMEHEQTRALGMLQQVPGSSVPLLGLPISFDGERPQPRSASPKLGADTAALLPTRTPE
jgi:crotonobetainyl-CoA:carnitine CoA-transferase CaiB-like acyl-CoA transferase